jgi:hypothetical protein
MQRLTTGDGELDGILGGGFANAAPARPTNILVLEVLLGDDLTRTIRVLKSRGSAHDGRRHPLRITQSGVAVDGVAVD